MAATTITTPSAARCRGGADGARRAVSQPPTIAAPKPVRRFAARKVADGGAFAAPSRFAGVIPPGTRAAVAASISRTTTTAIFTYRPTTALILLTVALLPNGRCIG
jgi:hypothetical protein